MAVLNPPLVDSLEEPPRLSRTDPFAAFRARAHQRRQTGSDRGCRPRRESEPFGQSRFRTSPASGAAAQRGPPQSAASTRRQCPRRSQSTPPVRVAPANRHRLILAVSLGFSFNRQNRRAPPPAIRAEIGSGTGRGFGVMYDLSAHDRLAFLTSLALDPARFLFVRAISCWPLARLQNRAEQPHGHVLVGVHHRPRASPCRPAMADTRTASATSTIEAHRASHGPPPINRSARQCIPRRRHGPI